MRDSNPPSQRAKDCRTTHQTERPPVSAVESFWSLKICQHQSQKSCSGYQYAIRNRNSIVNPSLNIRYWTPKRKGNIHKLRGRKGTARLIARSLKLRAWVTLASLVWCYQLGECVQPFGRRPVCFCSQSGGGVTIRLHTRQQKSSDWGRRIVRFVRLALKVVKLYDWDFTDVILLYFYLKILLYKKG
jgi:hypothetical protein